MSGSIGKIQRQVPGRTADDIVGTMRESRKELAPTLRTGNGDVFPFIASGFGDGKKGGGAGGRGYAWENPNGNV